MVSQKVKSLIDDACANFLKQHNGIFDYCLLEPEPAKQCVAINGSRCRWLEEAVLPLNANLETLYHAELKAQAGGYELTKLQKSLVVEEGRWAGKARVKCNRCGEIFPAGSNREKYCGKCRGIVRREQARQRMQNQRKIAIC